MARSTINSQEISKFTRVASQWWDVDGEYKLLHRMNPVRIEYIKQCVDRYINRPYYNRGFLPFTGLRMLDVGCGGGILSIAMHRLGADITGIDAGHENIEAAKNYADAHQYKASYINITTEDMAMQAHNRSAYDVILCMEVIEHVEDFGLLLESISSLLADGGLLILSTMNRTLRSYFKAIFIGERILSLVAKGTHDWNKFLKPSEIVNLLEKREVFLRDLSGIHFDILGCNWSIKKEVDTNYILCAQKNKV